MRVFIIACLIAAAPPLSALTVRPLSFDQLVDQSVAIVHGHVQEVRGQWTADRRGIESLVIVEVEAYLKGGLGERITVKVPGGEAGGYVNIIPGAPRLSPGDDVVLFLTASGPAIPVITGTSQGVYRVTADPHGARLVVPPVFEAAGPIIRGDVTRRAMPISAFTEAVRAVGAAR